MPREKRPNSKGPCEKLTLTIPTQIKEELRQYTNSMGTTISQFLVDCTNCVLSQEEITLSLSPETISRLKEYARICNVSPSQAVATLIWNTQIPTKGND